MAFNPSIMKAVEHLGYRVTVADIAAQTGLDLNSAQQGLLVLASDAGGHLQVSQAGDIAYQFPRNFRGILRSKFLRLQLQQWWEKIWRVLFYLIRISFAIALLVSIVLIFVTIALILIAVNSSRDSDDRGDSGGGIVFLPNFWFGPDWFWIFYPDYDSPRYDQRRGEKPQLNFLLAVFSFLFGDGNPNANLEARRWQEIATVIRNNGGAVVAEQIAPYLDNLGSGYAKEYEDYMLPVLTRFNGYPAVSPEGQIVYRFPELQVTARTQKPQPVQSYLKELPWRFSQATSGQIMLSVGLGVLNFVGALVLGNLLADGIVAAQLGGFVAFVQSIYWLLLGYGTAFLAVPLIRYFWIQWRNSKIAKRNDQRQQRAMLLNQADADLQKKIAYARQFATETVINREDLAYTTETDLIEQELEQSEQIDAEWQRRLNQSGS
ncbi:hypothetical protein [Microseira wollei]|uniref:Uncharacterized protein n=1 Tax=Microseira wollei NIES-4236 TaxID=2530354 RepID=A0AAV3XMJ2_9CYAN|nr:hypothetical protein [Microseira wollei]GET44132.1 hypothetical protein MiSe_89580 [Microseira wollei NIES-4236]